MKVVAALLARKVQINGKDEKHNSPLHLATMNDHSNVAGIL